jgi:hypothetical protein
MNMTLYSKNGEEPQTLPHRIILSNGKTRTDSSSFTEDELLEAGYVIAPDKPETKESWEIVCWNRNRWEIENVDLDVLKSQKTFI